MVAHELFEECITLVGEHIVKANARANEHLFYLGKRLNPLKKLYIFAMVCYQIRTRSRHKALSVATNATLKLFFACRVAEICRRSANIVNITLEIAHFGNELSLAHNAFN